MMQLGRVQQIGTPEQVHSQPANPFVARFIGGSNLVTGRLDADDRLVLSDGSLVPFFTRPISIAFATVTILILLLYIPAFKSLVGNITGAIGSQIKRLTCRQA